MISSGQMMEDVKTLSMQQFPETGKHDACKYWDAYLVLMGSAMFRAGVEAGWPKRQRVNISGEYSSSAGSHDLSDNAVEAPTPPWFSRRRLPVGQKTACGCLGEALTGPRRSNRQLLVSSQAPSSPNSRACSNNRTFWMPYKSGV